MNLKAKLSSNAHIFIAFILFIQPIMNVISYWFTEWSMPSSITLLMRLGVLFITVLYSFSISEKKNIYFAMSAIMIAVYALHAIVCFIENSEFAIVGDLSNYIRVIQMPVCVICFITLFKHNGKTYQGIQFGITAALILIYVVMIVSTLTGTDPHTYTDGKGMLGWFNNTNTQSANLSTLLPLSLGWQLTWKNKKKPACQILFWATVVTGFLAMYYFCTRLAYLGIIAASVGLGVIILILNRKEWIKSAVLFALAILFVVLLPVSPMMDHKDNDDEWQGKVQGWADEKVEELEVLDKMTKKEKIKNLSPLYAWKAADFVEIFGYERTMELFDYTTDIYDFTDIREKKIMFGECLMEDSSNEFLSRLFGLELARFTVNTQQGEMIYDVENDFHGIYYLYGITGLVAYLIFLGYFIYLVIWALWKNAAKYFTMEAGSMGIGLVMCLIHAYLTAGVLRRPDASIFLSALLAIVYYLVKLKEYPDIPKKERKPKFRRLKAKRRV
ncbi:MAG: O-antigen ligase family protein [Clostridia bacterium]|nr:O-antigen ligase family protein [Clostridia bacterium]